MLRCHTGVGVRKDPVRTRNEKHRRQLLEMQRRLALTVDRVEPLNYSNRPAPHATPVSPMTTTVVSNQPIRPTGSHGRLWHWWGWHMHVKPGVNHLLSLFGLIAVQNKEFFFFLASLPSPPPSPDADFSRVAVLAQIGEMGGRGTNGLVSRGNGRGSHDKFSRAKRSGRRVSPGTASIRTSVSARAGARRDPVRTSTAGFNF